MLSDRDSRPGHVLAVDVGGTTMKAEVLAADLTPLAVGAAPTPRGDAAAALAQVGELGRGLLATLEPADRDRVLALGLALPGIVDTAAGRTVLSANLGWGAVAVTTDLDLPVVLSHDVAAAGLAEWRHGAGRGVDDLAVVVVGTGIAAVLVSGGALLRGGLRQAGELGHIVVRPQGPPCGCGSRGCLEAVASAGAIARAYAAATGREVTGAEQVRALLGIDPEADRVWRDATDALADGLATVAALLSPARVVLGGGLSGAGAALLDPVRERLATLSHVVAVPEVVVAALGSRAGVVGAALAAWDRYGVDVAAQPHPVPLAPNPMARR